MPPLPHHERMVEAKFNNPADLFPLAFVCAMWLTGFDAPGCSARYPDKPMRDFTFMQTIARDKRLDGECVWGGRVIG